MAWPYVDRLDAELPPSFLGSRLAPPPKIRKIAHEAPPAALLSADHVEQEAQLVVDALHVLGGSEGANVHFVATFLPEIWDDQIQGPEYAFNPGIDPGLAGVLRRLAEISRWRYAVQTFSDSFTDREHGRVNHALCAAFHSLLDEFTRLVARVEAAARTDPEFSLYKMWLLLQPFEPKLQYAYYVVQSLVQESQRRRDLKVQAQDDTALSEQYLSERATDQLVEHDNKDVAIELRGGAVLRQLAAMQQLQIGNRPAQLLLKQLLAAASQPYLEMLARWIWGGEIVDFFDEFLVRETPADPRLLAENRFDEHWAKRYTVRKLDLPLQLGSSAVYNRLVAAGKYLNVVRECGGLIEAKDQGDSLGRDIEDPSVVEAIGFAYRRANKALLDLLFDKFDLAQRLTSLRYFFFLEGSDFLLAFLQSAASELDKPVTEASVARLQLKLGAVLSQEGSVSALEPHADECRIDLAPMSLREELLRITAASEDLEVDTSETREGQQPMKALHAFQLDFDIPFPLSLVVSRVSVCRYQFIFRHLTEIKHAEYALGKAWVSQSTQPQWRFQSEQPDVQAAKRRAQDLRARMALFVGHMMYYCAVDVLESGSRAFETRLRQVRSSGGTTDVNTLVQDHMEFLTECLRRCFLTNANVLKLQSRLLDLVRMYADFLSASDGAMAWIEWGTLPEEQRPSIAQPMYRTKSGDVYNPEDLLEWFLDRVDQYDRGFEKSLRRFVAELAADSKLGSSPALLSRLEALLGSS